jgi:hypothetical protein
MVGQTFESLNHIGSLLFVAVESLNEVDFVSAQKSFDVLFRGLDPDSINFQPVLDMAAQYFTHLGVACK